MYRDSLTRFALLCALVVVLVPAGAAAQTSDVPASAIPSAVPAPPASPVAQAPRAPYRWSGFYLGIHADYGRGIADTTFEPLPGSAQVNFSPTTLSPDPNGLGFRISGGASGRSGILLFGAEADWSMPNTDGDVTQSPIIQSNGSPLPGNGFISASQSTDWIVTACGRGGIVVANRVMIYGTAGLAFASVNYQAETDFRPTGATHYPADFSKKKWGWVVGIGAEYRLNRLIGIQGEWRYMDLRDESTTIDAVPASSPLQMKYTWKTQATTYTAGFILHF